MNQLSDKVVSLLRTVVPVIWGSLIAWLLTVISLPASVTGFLTNQTDVVVVVAIAAWYAAFRWLEPKLPAWLTRIVLGSNQTPTYAPVAAPLALSTTVTTGTIATEPIPVTQTSDAPADPAATFPPGSPGAEAALAQGPPATPPAAG